MIHHNASGVDILAAPSHPEDAETVDGKQFAKVLNYLKRLYTYVIVDTASGLSDITLETIENSDVFVLLTTQGIPAINNSRIMLGLLEALGINKKRIVLVMSRYDKRIAITAERVGENLNQAITVVIPEDPRVVIPSVNRGVPFMMDVKKARTVGEGMLKLTEVIRESLAEFDDIGQLEG
ncbi:MAG: hypothetical protein B5M51_07745 [Anaerolinea sp. 4484_236]|nr:MAG: hypothetical protein B5M51_07745 [Anaerolinea sp. 4484_236]